MNYLRQLCAAVALLFVLSLPARAGEITIWGIAPPTPPPPVPASASVTTPGEMTTWGAYAESETLATEITVSILQLLSVV